MKTYLRTNGVVRGIQMHPYVVTARLVSAAALPPWLRLPRASLLQSRPLELLFVRRSHAVVQLIQAPAESKIGQQVPFQEHNNEVWLGAVG